MKIFPSYNQLFKRKKKKNNNILYISFNKTLQNFSIFF